MQKLINVIALLSGLTSLAVLGGGAYLYTQKDAMIEQARENLANAAVEAVTSALPGILDKSIPTLPTTTGPAVPMVKSGPDLRLP